jgi:hypothetical protein
MKAGTGNLNGKYLIGITAILVLLLVVPAVFSQQAGIVEGRLVNGTDPAIVPGGVPLEILDMNEGMGIIRTSATDATGRFRIEKLPLRSMLMLRAVYEDANYNKQIGFDDSGHASFELEVFEAATSMNGVRVEEFQMVFHATGSYIESLDTVAFNNETKPPRTFMNPEGNFRFSKAPAIDVLPQMRITAPGSSMPVVQSALESPDGKSYYSLYPFRPGRTTVEVFQLLPYENRNYAYVKKFYYKVPSIEIGVIPMNMELSGTGLSKVRTEPEGNIAVYRSASIEAGTEVEWIFSGGAPVAEREVASSAAESNVRSAPNYIVGNAHIIGPLLLVGFVVVFWYAFSRVGSNFPKTTDARKRQLKERREFLLNRLADLDRRYEARSLEQRKYLQQRKEGERMLRRIKSILDKSD